MPVALSDGDLHGILEFVFEASEADGPGVFTEPARAAFRKLVPAAYCGSLNVFGGLDTSSKPEQRSILDFATVDCEWGFGEGEWTDEMDEICRLFVAEYDFVQPRPQFMLRPTRVSDLWTQRELRKNKLWLNVGRHVGSNDGLWLWLPAPEEGLLRRVTFDAEKRGGVTERDVRVIEVLTPYLVQLYRRAATRRRASEVDGLTPREYEVMALVGEGKTNEEIARVLWVAPATVKKHLENTYAKLGVSNRTAAVARLRGVAAGNGHPQSASTG